MAGTKPKVSVIIPTFNSGPVFEKCLKSIRDQKYDQRKIEILIADGGSKDRTITTANKFKAKVIPENTGSPEAAKAVALRHARGEFCLMMASDNILPSPGWLGEMTAILKKEPQAAAVYPWRYTWRKTDTPLNRYFALTGVNDPVALFLKKADRQSYLADKWRLAGKAKDKGDYFLVEFNTRNMPTLGDNGHLIRKKLLAKAKVTPEFFYHIDVNWDLVKLGHKIFAVAKNEIIHATGDDFWKFFRKRKKYMENLYLMGLNVRRYLVYDRRRDRKKIIAFSLYALTLAGPAIFAIKGYLKKKDAAWFLHSLVCFLIFWIYFTSVVNWQSWWHYGRITRKIAGQK